MGIIYEKTLLQSGKSVKYNLEIKDGFETVRVKMDTFAGRGINPHFANDTSFINGVQYFFNNNT